MRHHAIIARLLYELYLNFLLLQVEGQVSAMAIDPLEIVPPELYIAWTDSIQ